MQNQTLSLMFRLLRRELDAAPEPETLTLTETEAEALLALSDRFGLAHLVGDALFKAGTTLPEKTAAAFRDRLDRALYRYCFLDRELNSMGALFEAERIPYIPLKGAVMRRYYPETWMRGSSDLDVLIHPEDLERAEAALTSRLSYRRMDGSSHDVAFMSSANIRVELHFRLMEANRANDAGTLLNETWAHASSAGDSFRYELDAPVFLYYHLAHMAKHLENGVNCGVRPFLDLWILDRREEFRGEACDSLLREGKMTAFAGQCRKLIGVWMEARAHDEDTERFERYLFEEEEGKKMALKTARHRSRAGTALSMLVPSFDYMKNKSSVTRKHPWLTPFLYIRRWCKLFSPEKLKSTIRSLRTMAHLKKDQQNEARLLMQRLGLK